MKQQITNNQSETKEIAAKIAKNFKGGEVLGLVGELGSGKTVFTQGVAEALGITEVVNSPTFVLMKVYDVSESKSSISMLVHVDAYRLSNSQELNDIGLNEYIGRKGTAVIIEWADKVKDILPGNSLIVEFKQGKNENQRIVKIKD